MRAGPLLQHAPVTRIKVCCISSVDEAELALEAGANALGLVSAMPSGPGVIADRDIAEIGHAIGDRAATVLLTSRQSAAAITEQLENFRPTVLQLVDALPNEELQRLRDAFPAMALMPVVHVQGGEALATATNASNVADAILLDSGNPSAAVKELGGTGRVHDWQVSRAIREAVAVPVFLAGGLRVDNIGAAIAAVRPHGVDVCSGVRRDGRLHRETLMAFVSAVRAAG
jgi:phosphoribosylanthranilate isomerase